MIKKLSKKLYQPLIKPYKIVQTLNEFGHAKSIKKGLSVDKKGKPIPWFTYPSLHYLNQLDLKEKVVFEWGSGYSSVYFCSKSRKVFSVDHNKQWYEEVLKFKPVNHTLSLAEGEDYVNNIAQHNCKFDIIVIDGILRGKCCKIAVNFLNEGGIIIFDNSDRHPEEAEYLRNQGLIEVDFHGFGPIGKHTWTTSIFFHRTFNFTPLNEQPAHPGGHDKVL